MSTYYPRQSSVRTGLHCACPRCGEGKLYEGLLTVRDRCPVCDFDYTSLNTDDGPAFFIIVLYSALILPLAAWFQFAVAPPIWVHFLVWIPVIVVGAIALMRPFKAWLIAQQFKHNVTDADFTR
ncbi:MAG: DUF983 domain-containing protein [Alphaproteobacteria bacterium]